MILADKIINERKKNGWSQEELAEMLSVSRQSVSKWESAQAVPDLNRIIKMAEIFGVSTDYLLKDEIEAPVESDNVSDEDINIRKVSLEDASRYISIVKKNNPIASIATMLFVLCPVVLIELAGLASYYSGIITENIAALIGLIILFVCIAIGVIGWLMVEGKEKEFNFLDKEEYETLYGVDGMVKEKKADFDKKKMPLLFTAIVLFILCPVGVITAGLLEVSEFIIVSMVALLLMMVAAGVGIMIYIARTSSIYKNLLKEDKLSKEQQRRKNAIGKLGGAYWCLVVAAYLVMGIGFNRWEFAGIVFPIAGVLYAAILGILKVCFNDVD